MKECDVLFIGYAANQSSGGFSDKSFKFLDTSDAKYLYNNCFLDTYCVEPMAFMQLAAELEKKGFSVEVVDGLILRYDKEQLIKEINKIAAKVVSISIYESTKNDIYDIANYLKRTRPNIKITSGGPYGTIEADRILKECADIDYIVVGDGDAALPCLVETIFNNGELSEVPNLFYRENGIIKSTKAECVDINTICRPKRLYSDIIKQNNYAFAISASRGCGYAACGFCYLRKYQRIGNQPKFRFKNANLVYDEIVELIDKLGIDKLSFTDEDFFGNMRGIERAVELFDMLISSKIRISLHVNARVNTILYLIRNNLLEKCKLAGVDYMYVGLESYNDRILAQYDKGITVAKIDEVVEALDKYDIRINPGLITFDPSITVEEVKRNIDLFRKIKYYDAFIFTRRLVFYPESSDKVSELKNESSYFVSEQTDMLFKTMEKYVGMVFPWFLKLNRDISTDELCRKIIDNHFNLFYEAYSSILSNKECWSLVDKYSSSTIQMIEECLG